MLCPVTLHAYSTLDFAFTMCGNVLKLAKHVVTPRWFTNQISPLTFYHSGTVYEIDQHSWHYHCTCVSQTKAGRWPDDVICMDDDVIQAGWRHCHTARSVVCRSTLPMTSLITLQWRLPVWMTSSAWMTSLGGLVDRPQTTRHDLHAAGRLRWWRG